MEVIESIWSVKEMDNRLFDGANYDILGFYGKYLGVPDRYMLGRSFLTECFDGLPTELEWLTKPSKWLQNQFSSCQTMLCYLNDQKLAKSQKKANLYRVFKATGVSITWIDK